MKDIYKHNQLISYSRFRGHHKKLVPQSNIKIIIINVITIKIYTSTRWNI